MALIFAAARPDLAAESIVYHDGTELSGTIRQIDAETLLLEGQGESVALYEIGAIRFHAASARATPAKTVSDAPGPVLCFREGQLLAADVVNVRTRGGSRGSTQVARVSLQDVSPFEVPLELLWGFRLERPHRRDGLFRNDLATVLRAPSGTSRPRMTEDRIYVRRGSQLLRVGGVLRSLDEDFLVMEYKGKTRRIPRERLFGAILAPVASRHVEGGYPAVFQLRSGGEFPAFLAGMQKDPNGKRQLLVRFRGSAPEARQAIPVEQVQRVQFFSDRVTFLSALAPIRVREVPLIGSRTGFPWRKDRATTGNSLRLAGKTYRKGLGVHSFSSLEFDIGGRYSSFAATIGLVENDRQPDGPGENAREGAGVTFRVFADGKMLYEKDIVSTKESEKMLLPVTKVRRLRLEVDYGKDGVDSGDHAAWAEARVIKQ